MSREQNQGIAQIWSIVFVDFALPMLGSQAMGKRESPGSVPDAAAAVQLCRRNPAAHFSVDLWGLLWYIGLVILRHRGCFCVPQYSR